MKDWRLYTRHWDRKWLGEKPLVIGVIDDDGIKEEYVVQPGEEIPARALELLKEDEYPLEVPYRGEYSRQDVKDAHRKENPS